MVENMRLKQSQEIELARSITEIESIVRRACIWRSLKNRFLSGATGTDRFCHGADGKWARTGPPAGRCHRASCIVICAGMPKQNVTIIDQNEACFRKAIPMWQAV